MSKSAVTSWCFSYKKLDTTCNITIKLIDVGCCFSSERNHTQKMRASQGVFLCALLFLLFITYIDAAKNFSPLDGDIERRVKRQSFTW